MNLTLQHVTEPRGCLLYAIVDRETGRFLLYFDSLTHAERYIEEKRAAIWPVPARLHIAQLKADLVFDAWRDVK